MKLPKPDASLVVNPGDVLVLRYDNISPLQAGHIRERWQTKYPAIPLAIVQADGMAVVRKPERTDDETT